jgi:hypothetical protein
MLCLCIKLRSYLLNHLFIFEITEFFEIIATLNKQGDVSCHLYLR